MSVVTLGSATDPTVPPRPAGRLRGGLSELGRDIDCATRWYRRGRLVTSPIVPQVARRWLLRRGGVTLGRGVCGMERCWFQSSKVSIGDECYLNAGSWFEGDGRIDIGANTGIGPEVIILTSHHSRGPNGFKRQTEYLDVTIGARCWLGTRAVVMGGVTIGDDVVLAAGALANRDLPAGGVYAGIPARRVK